MNKARLLDHLQKLLFAHEVQYRKCGEFTAQILYRRSDVVNGLINDNEPVVDFAHRLQFHRRALTIQPFAFNFHRLVDAGGIDYRVHSGVSLGHERQGRIVCKRVDNDNLLFCRTDELNRELIAIPECFCLQNALLRRQIGLHKEINLFF